MADTTGLKFSSPFIDPKTGVLQHWAYQYLLNPSVSNINLANGGNINAAGATITAHAVQLGIPLRPSSGGTGQTTPGAAAANAIGALAQASNLSDVANVGTSRTNLGLGSIATVNSPLPVANGGTGQTAAGATAANAIGALAEANNLSDLANAVTARTNLGLGTMAVENSSGVSISGGSIDGTTVGVTTPAAAKVTTLTATGAVTFTSGTVDGIPIGGSTPAVGAFTTLSSTGRRADTSYSYQTPATGFNITIGNNVYTLILDPAGALLTGTIVMAAAPVDGQVVRITSTQNISTLTLSPNVGQSISNAPTGFTVSLTGSIGYEFIYRTANTTWYRLQ